jgi:dihydroorotase
VQLSVRFPRIGRKLWAGKPQTVVRKLRAGKPRPYEKMTTIIIKNGHVIDPANKIDGTFDVTLEKGHIADVGRRLKISKAADVIDAKGSIVAPGFVDMHVHLREPGQEYKETIATGTKAAAVGGFTSVCCMANTDPVNDNAAVTTSILRSAREKGVVNVFPIGAVTKNLDGKELAEIGELKESGCVALSDDGRTISNSAIFRRALEYAKSFHLPVISHALCADLMGSGVMNEGFVSTELGLRGIPHEAEEVIITRDIALAGLTGCPVHIAHISTARGVELIREAKKRKVPISAEATPHHFTLTDEVCRGYDPNTKMAPPLRTEADIRAIKKGLADGTIDAIATDHAPHAPSDKEVDFEEAPFGIIGLETALPLSLRLVEERILSLKQMIEVLSFNPSKLMKIDRGTLSKGQMADVVIFSTDASFIYDVGCGASKSKNSPFHGWKLKGRVVYTIVGGKIVYRGKN